MREPSKINVYILYYFILLYYCKLKYITLYLHNVRIAIDAIYTVYIAINAIKYYLHL